MAYILPADFVSKTRKSWTQGLALDEITDLDTVIAQVELQINADLNDDFEPAGGDPDVTLELSSYGTARLDLPRRCRSITTLKTRNSAGTLFTEVATNYRLRSSLDATGTAMVDGAVFDWVDIVSPISTGSCWPVGWQAVQIVGKFGWASPPTDIKRLTALLVYDYVKASGQGLRKTERLQTDQATFTFIPSDPDDLGIPEADRIRARYKRPGVLVR